VKTPLLIADQTAELGGSPLGLLDLLPELACEFSPLVAVPATGPYTDRLQQLGIPWTLWPLGSYSPGDKSAADVWRYLRQSPASVNRLTQLVRETGAALLLANGPRAYPAAAVTARRCRIPSIWQLHLELTSGRDRQLCRAAARLARPMIVACSEACLRVFPPNSSARRNSRVMYPGVAEPRVLLRDPTAVGVVGRLHPDKGQDILLEAARLTPTGTIRLFFGEQVPAYRRQLERLAEGLPPGTVEFRGWTDDIGAALGGLRALVVPSRREALARVIMEAFAAGVPVVAARTGGIPEVVVHEHNGLLFPSGDAPALAAALRRILNDAVLRQRLTGQARRDYQERYLISRYRSDMLTLLRGTLKTSA
jgi:hypothetical protein